MTKHVVYRRLTTYALDLFVGVPLTRREKIRDQRLLEHPRKRTY